MDNSKKTFQISISDDVLKGTYSNQTMIAHTHGEFVMDFMMVFPPKGIIGSRVVISPGHAKRLLMALQNNISQYEKQFGPIRDEPPPTLETIN